MDSPSPNIGVIRLGSITAPAGCGKTQLISDFLRSHVAAKPVLVLTHTNAGVAALRSRLQRASVPSASYRISTIDGWAISLVSLFPNRSGCGSQVLRLEQPSSDYPAIREYASRLIQAGHIAELLRATYDRIIVDEYQDCSVVQHDLLVGASDSLPTCVLGDPMQAIFGFRGNRLVDWDRDVISRFPSCGVLETPWRWINAGAGELGAWLLQVRAQLASGRPVDLRSAPASVTWIQTTVTNSHQQQLTAARSGAGNANDRVLIIGDSTSPAAHRMIASQTPGALTVEAVDLRDLISFARSFSIDGEDALEKLVRFAGDQMTGVGVSNLLRRIETLSRGRGRLAPSPAEAAALEFERSRSWQLAAGFLEELGKQPDVRIYRPQMFYGCLSAMRSVSGGGFPEAAAAVREQYRHQGRDLPKRAVGSTLLLKGLEADSAIVLNPAAMDARHLYVALTRGAKKLVVCSPSPLLSPR